MKPLHTVSCYVVLVSMLLLLGACKGDNDPTPMPEVPTSTSIPPTHTPAPPPAPENMPPQIVSVSASPVQICPGDTTKLIAVVTDADGDPLQYVWSSNIGIISDKTNTESGSEATYQAATTTGADVITLTVLDGQGGQDQRQTNVKIKDDCPAEVSIVSPVQTLSCSRSEDTPSVCQFSVEGTTESVVSHSQYDNLRLYVLVFPEDPPGAGWYIQVQPGAIQSDGTWSQSPAYVGNAGAPAQPGDTIKIISVVVSQDAIVHGINGNIPIANITGQNNDNVVRDPRDIEGDFRFVSDEIQLTILD